MARDLGDAPASYTFTDYVTLVRRRWAWLILGLLIGLAAGNIIEARLPESYTSEASLIVTEPSSSMAPIGSNDINLDTEAQLIRSAEVASRAAEILGGAAVPTELAENVTVTVPPNSQVLTVSYEASSPGRAQAGAAAFSQAYLDSRSELAQADIDSELEKLQDELDTANDQLDDVLDELGELLETATERPALEARRAMLLDQISAINQQVGELSRLDPRPGRIITAAFLPTSPSGPSPTIILVSTVGLGLLLGCGLMAIRERADRRILDAGDVERVTGLRVIGSVPPPAPWGATALARRQAYERLRNVMVSASGRLRLFLITGSDGDASVEQVASSLAAHLAATGRRVALIDPAAPTNPTDLGLSDVLADSDWSKLGLPEAGEEWNRPGKYLSIHAGTEADLLHHRLAGAGSHGALTDLRRLVDIVLVIGPRDNALAQTIAALSDGVVHVAARRRSRQADLVASVEQSAQVDARSVGVVLVDYPSRIGVLMRKAKARRRKAQPRVDYPPRTSAVAPIDEIRDLDALVTGLGRSDQHDVRPHLNEHDFITAEHESELPASHRRP